jgi:hypothetical protein
MRFGRKIFYAVYAQNQFEAVPFGTEKTVCFHGDVGNFVAVNRSESKTGIQPAHVLGGPV